MNYASSAFDRHGVIDVNPLRPIAAGRTEAASLSAMERTVVSLSLQDSEQTIGEATTWRRMCAHLLGQQLPTRLASEPLEELRRFAILTRLRGKVDDETLDRFLDAGYTIEQANLVTLLISRHMPKRRSLRSTIITCLLIAAAAVGMYLLLQSVLEEPAISLIVTGVASVTVASLIAPKEHRAD